MDKETYPLMGKRFNILDRIPIESKEKIQKDEDKDIFKALIKAAKDLEDKRGNKE